MEIIIYLCTQKYMTMLKWIRKLLRRNAPAETAQPLRIEGVAPAAMTPEPDDAELAAQALLELLAGRAPGKEDGAERPEEGTAEYYRLLADRIRQAHAKAELRTRRFVAWCEQELKRGDIPLDGKDSLAQMETELYKRIDTVDREGGELKRRWQHCLAEVIVRRMQPAGKDEESNV